MRDLYARTQPVSVRKWTDQTDRHFTEPVRTLTIVTRGDYERPTGPIETNCHVREMGTCAPGPRLNLVPRRRRGWRGLVARMMRIHS